MSISRRSILGLFQAIPFAPSLARGAAAEVEKQLTGIGPLVGAGRLDDPLGDPMSEFYTRQRSRTETFLQLFERDGLPEWKRRELHRRAKEVEALDPDIAALHSISTGAKIRMQAKRNEERLIDDEINSLKRRLVRADWLKAFGVDD